MNPLRHSGLPFEEQRTLFVDMMLADPLVGEALQRAAALALPDWLIVSGALYNTAWNHLSGRPSGHGIKDIDLFYFDASDLSWEAEDVVVRRAASTFADLPMPVEIRNQARVHLWYEKRFGIGYPRLGSSAEALFYFASKTHAVGIRQETGGRHDLVAPFGLDDIFSFRIVPNRVLDNAATHAAKGERAKRNWPEIEIVPW